MQHICHFFLQETFMQGNYYCSPKDIYTMHLWDALATFFSKWYLHDAFATFSKDIYMTNILFFFSKKYLCNLFATLFSENIYQFICCFFSKIFMLHNYCIFSKSCKVDWSWDGPKASWFSSIHPPVLYKIVGIPLQGMCSFQWICPPQLVIDAIHTG